MPQLLVALAVLLFGIYGGQLLPVAALSCQVSIGRYSANGRYS
jgi:hypothetical protein